MSAKQKQSAAKFCRERFTVHGKTKTPEFNIWQLMIRRCYHRINRAYPDYGGRGISVCKRWRESFEMFLKDMGCRPSTRMTLGRIKNDGNYEPSNCRWETRKQQNNNTRWNRIIAFNGKNQTLTQWSEETGIKVSTISMRLDHYRWTIPKALCVRP